MWDVVLKLVDTDGFLPRWLCGQWTAFHGWVHIVSDIAIWTAYTVIPVILLQLVTRRRDTPFPKIFWLFAAFIFWCGLTHLVEAVMFWWPGYRFMGAVKVVTAVVSWSTAIVLMSLMPQILALRSAKEVEKEVLERKRMQDTLQQSEARYRLLVSCIKDYAILMLDPKGHIVSWRGGAAQIYGYSREEAHGLHFSRFYSDEENQACKPANELKIAVENGRFEEEGWRIRKDGIRFWANVIITPMLDDTGELVGFTKVTRDLTERKNVMEQLKQLNEDLERQVIKRTSELMESEDRYRRVLAGSNDGVWDWDLETRDLYWNDRLFEMHGLTRETFTPTLESFLELVYPKDRHRVADAIAAHLETDESFELEIRQRHVPSGEYRHFFARGKAVRNEEGKPIRMSGTAVDITERKQMELELARAKEQAEVANRKKSQFLATMSHELRTPLNAIIGYSEMLESGIGGTLTEKQERYIHNVVISGRHLLDMVNDILDLSKIEAGKFQILLEWIRLEPFVYELSGMIKDLADRKNIRLHYAIQPGLTGLEADPARLRQILLNLLSNAIKFNREAGEVHVRFSLDEDTGWVVCEVRDTGIGIPEDKISELFSEFYQVDPSYSRRHEGTGLGLALTRRLVELHGGMIFVRSKLGEGSVFTFRLPTRIPVTGDVAFPSLSVTGNQERV